MTLPLELGQITDPSARRALEQISLRWPTSAAAASAAGITVVSSLPPTGADGDAVFLTGDNSMYVWNAGSWHKISPGPQGPAGVAGPAGATGPQGPPGTGGGGSGGALYQQAIGDGTAQTFTVTHNLGTRAVNVTAYRTASPYDEVVIEVEHTSVNTVTLRTLTIPAVNELTVLIGAGGDMTYVHTQGSPSTTWTVTHDLGKYPAIVVVDTGDSVVIPNVHYDSTSAVTLSFGSATSGKAFCN